MTPTVIDAPLYLAAVRWASTAGFRLELVRLESNSQAIDLLASGKLDMAGGYPGVELYDAIARGVPLKMVADRASGAVASVVVRKDLYDSRAVTGLKELKGRKLAVSSGGSATHLLALKALEQGGLKPDDVDLVEMDEALSVALARKSIDAAVMMAGFDLVEAEEKGLTVPLASNRDLWAETQASVLLYSPKFVEENPDYANWFADGYLRAIREYYDAYHRNKNKQRMISAVVARSAIKDGRLWGNATAPGINPDGFVNHDWVAKDYRWYRERGLLKADVDLEVVVDNSFMEDAVGRIGKY